MILGYKVREASDAEWFDKCACSDECENGVTRILNGRRKDGSYGDIPYCEFHYQILLTVAL